MNLIIFIVMDIPEMQDRLSDIEMNIRNVGSGTQFESFNLMINYNHYLPKLLDIHY